ncbi:hypothetical protein [Micromonospora fulviviridis]|uniref:hypothetical protein n=1 Tax=Micromonospora fulviviridis TaxID=47860 RepID=UPI0037BC3B95
MLRRYEDLLALPELSLVTASDAVHRFYGDIHQPSWHDDRDTNPRPSPMPMRWHDLLARARVPYAMTGSSWAELTDEIGRRPDLVLHPPTLWDDVCQNLISELVLAEGRQWLLRQEAMCRLLEHADAGPPAVRACVALAEDPMVPVFITPLSLLDVTTEPGANRYILDQLGSPHNELAHQGALLATIRKLRAGHFRTDSEWQQLTASAQDLAADPGPDPAVRSLGGELFAGLARALPRRDGSLQRSAARHVGRQSVIWPDLSPAAAAMVKDVVDRARSLLPVEPTDDDSVLAALIAEAMHSPNSDQRLYAVMLIAATPYRRPVATAVLTVARRRLREWDPPLIASALRVLTLLKTPDHQELVYRLLTDPAVSPPLRHAAASATPHWSARMDIRRWQHVLAVQRQRTKLAPSTLDVGILRALTYGVATDGHHELLRDIEAGPEDPPFPALARIVAHWWLRLPPQLLQAAGS